MGLSKEELLQKGRVRIEKVTLPIGEIYVRTMTNEERDDWEVGQFMLNGKDVEVNRRRLRARLVIKCLCDEDGKRLFQDSDLAELASLDAAAIDPAYEAALRLNRLRNQDIEELEKNSVAGPAGDSSSVSVPSGESQLA